jgi:diguanylate cyclase (GGDEF)-like protein/PAS domain S-box-containing protein
MTRDAGPAAPSSFLLFQRLRLTKSLLMVEYRIPNLLNLGKWSLMGKTLFDVLTSDIISVQIGTTSSQAIGMMKEKKISCVLVLDGKKLAGIFTERNIVKAANEGIHFKSLPIERLMSSPVMTVRDHVDLYEAYDIMAANGIRHLVVINSTEDIIGIVTQTDMIRHLGIEYFVEFKKAARVMTRSVVTEQKDCSVWESLRKMAENNISCIIITDEKRPVGILTERDMTRLLFDKQDVRERLVEDVMSHPVVTIALDTPLFDAVALMKKNRVRRLVVVDGHGETIGLITQSDIVRGLEGQYIRSLKTIIREKEAQLRETIRSLKEKSVHLDNILRFSTDLAIIATDMNFRVTYYNPAAESIFGLKSVEVVGHTVPEIHDAKNLDPKRFRNAVEFVNKEGEYDFSFERKKRGKTYYMEGRMSCIRDQDGGTVGFVLMCRDVTKRKMLEAKVKESEQQFRSLTEHSLTGVALLQNRFLYVNPVFREITGYTAEELFAADPMNLLHPEYREKGRNLLTKRVLSKKRPIASTLKIVTRDGGEKWVELRANAVNHRGMPAVLINLIDMTERKLLEEELKKAARVDRLTGVFNRQSFETELLKEIKRSMRYHTPFSLIMLDIDHFKNINDSYGHLVGDSVLTTIAQVVKKNIRISDVLGRWGGEEFMILAPETSLNSAVLLAEKLKTLIGGNLFRTMEQVTASFGVAQFLENESPDSLVKRVDDALYTAKSNGRNRVETAPSK